MYVQHTNKKVDKVAKTKFIKVSSNHDIEQKAIDGIASVGKYLLH